MTDDLSKRAFVVGCGRSGTTLLESLLGAHQDIKAFPESVFFVGLIGQVVGRTLAPSDVPQRQKLGRLVSSARIRLGIAHTDGAAGRLPEFLEKIGRPDLLPGFPAESRSIAVQAGAFVRLLDQLTLDDRKRFWVEKTPNHLYYIPEIERYVRPARFIHMVRNGPDVVASYYDAGRKFPERWGYFKDSLDRCIHAWNRAIPVTPANAAKPNHLVVDYEQLVDNPELVLRRVCDFLQVDYDFGMIDRYAESARYVSAGEPWKEGVPGKIAMPRSKFTTLFTGDQRQYIQDRLIKLNPDRFFIR